MTRVTWTPDDCQHYCSDVSLAFFVNSPDINGDLVVNLQDIQLFVADYHGAYSFRSDFNFDGEVDLSDLAVLTGGVGATCATP